MGGAADGGGTGVANAPRLAPVAGVIGVAEADETLRCLICQVSLVLHHHVEFEKETYLVARVLILGVFATLALCAGRPVGLVIFCTQ